MKWTIRSAQIEDAAGILRILNPIIESGIHSALDTPFSLEEEKQFIANFPKRGVFHVAVNPEDQTLVGMQDVEPFGSYTHAFDHVGVIGTFVDGSYRRQGIAASLFAATFEASNMKGYEKLFAYVRDDNKGALATYLKHGFEIIGKAKKQAKINGAYIDEVFIERFL